MEAFHTRQLKTMETFHKEFEKRFNEMLSLQQDIMNGFLPKKEQQPKSNPQANKAKPAAKTKREQTRT